MRRPRIDPWFWAEMLAAAIALGLLAALAFISDARASGVTNMLLGAGGAPILSTTLTAGSNVVSGNGEVGYCVTASGVCAGSIGSISVSSIPGGYTIEAIEDLHVSGTIVPKVVITGFSANPGASWLNQVTFNSQTFMGSAATAFSYATGTGTWTWTSGFGFTNTDVYPGTITYQ